MRKLKFFKAKPSPDRHGKTGRAERGGLAVRAGQCEDALRKIKNSYSLIEKKMLNLHQKFKAGGFGVLLEEKNVHYLSGHGRRNCSGNLD
mgnify:FL=1